VYSVELSQKAAKFLDKLDKILSERIKKKLKNLFENPVPSDSKFIRRENKDKIFWIRIGDYSALDLIGIQNQFTQKVIVQTLKNN
jgi:mRNA-degrading endonuclease RelE of RelBE toxin-antitoxin system